MLDESCPSSHIRIFGTATNIFLTAGIMVAMLLIGLIPSESNLIADKGTSEWRLKYAVPIICQITAIIFHGFIFTEDTIAFNISQKNYKEALDKIRKIYAPSEKHKAILKRLKREIKTESQDVSVKEALFDPRFRVATWVGLAISILRQQTGIDGLAMYAFEIIQDMNRKG